MISLLLIRKHINRRLDLIHKAYQAEISFLSSRISTLESQLRHVESSVAASNVSHPWLISRKGCITLEDSTVRSAPASSGIVTNGKLPKKKTATAGVSGYRAGTNTSRHSASYADDAVDTQRFAGNTNHVYEDSASVHRHHGSTSHHRHDSDFCHNSFGDTGGHDSGYSDSSSSSGSFD